MTNLVQAFLKNTHPITYRAGAEKINHDLALSLIELFGGEEQFVESAGTVTSIGVEAVLTDDEALLDFYDNNTDDLLIEMYLIGYGTNPDTKHAKDYILNNTDCAYSELEVDAALDDDNNDKTTLNIRKWVVHQAASELHGNYTEYVNMVKNGEIDIKSNTENEAQ